MGLRIVTGNGARKMESQANAPQAGSVVAFNTGNHRSEREFDAESRTEERAGVRDEASSMIPIPTLSSNAKQFDGGENIDEQKRLIEEAKNHPRVKEALRIFGGEIIEVIKKHDGSTKAH